MKHKPVTGLNLKYSVCVFVHTAVVPSRLFSYVALVKMVLSLFTVLWSHGQGEGEVNHSSAPLSVGLTPKDEC